MNGIQKRQGNIKERTKSVLMVGVCHVGTRRHIVEVEYSLSFESQLLPSLLGWANAAAPHGT